MKTVQAISTAVISLDMGTSSIRACLMDESLNILFQRSISVRLDSDLDGRAEQDIKEIISAVLTCLREVTNKRTKPCGKSA
jgi:sugar (pentulose or hexulose) kinase